MFKINTKKREQAILKKANEYFARLNEFDVKDNYVLSPDYKKSLRLEIVHTSRLILK